MSRPWLAEVDQMWKIMVLLWKMSWNDPMKWQMSVFLHLDLSYLRNMTLWWDWAWKITTADSTTRDPVSTPQVLCLQIAVTCFLSTHSPLQIGKTMLVMFHKKNYSQWTNWNVTSAFSTFQTSKKNTNTEHIFSYIMFLCLSNLYKFCVWPMKITTLALAKQFSRPNWKSMLQ